MTRSARILTARPHFPLRRLALCLDCDECFEIGQAGCPACSGRSWTSLARFLDAARASIRGLLHAGRSTRPARGSDAERALARKLLIVARHRKHLFAYLKRIFAGLDTVEVVLDRRVGDRRATPGARAPERRRGGSGRRQNALVESELRTLGWAIVMMDLAADRAKTGS